MIGGLFGRGAAQAAANTVTTSKLPRARSLFGGRFTPFSFDPEVSKQDRMMAFGAMLSDLGQGGTENLAGLRQEQRQRGVDEQSRLKAEQDRLNAEQERNRMQYFNTRGGVVGVDRRGQSQMVYQAPEEPIDTMGGIPVGMQRTAEGGLEWSPGYIEAQESLGRTRRRVTIDNPIPSRARASSGGGGSSRSAASAPRSAPPSRKPWERY